MKHVLSFCVLTFLWFVFPSLLFGQQETVSLALAVPSEQRTYETDIMRLLRSRLSSSMADAELGMTDYSGLVLIPDITITNQQAIEGGMRTITSLDVNLSLTVVQIITGVEFHSFELRLRGQGYNKNLAVMNAVEALDFRDKRLKEFFVTAKKKIISYYKDNTKVLQTKASTLAKMGNYNEAIALLSSYPTGLSDYTEVAETMKEIYDQYQQHSCAQLMQQARGAYSIGNYDECIALLNEIDMSSPCASDARALANKVRTAVNAEKAQEIALYQESMRTVAEIEKRRIQAEENAAIAYYKNQPKYYFVF